MEEHRNERIEKKNKNRKEDKTKLEDENDKIGRVIVREWREWKLRA